MNFIHSFNILFAPLGILGFIVIDYSRNKCIDRIQRRIYNIIVFATIAAIVSEMFYEAYKGMQGETLNRIFYISTLLFLIFQPIAHNTMFVFFDYSINKNLVRTKRLSFHLGSILCIYIIVLVFNIRSGFIFHTTSQNEFVMGGFYFIRHIISFSPVFWGILDIFLCRKAIHRHQITLFLIFVLPILLGTALDFFIPGLRIVWPSSCISILFAYFFIIRSDYSIDSLTGVNNRRSFDEFLKNIIKTMNKKPCIYIMIDMDHFKQINDVWGHMKGDIALKDTAQLLKGSIRQTDFIARYGGDEFIMIILNTDNASCVINRIQGNLLEFNKKNNREFQLAFSVGYDIYTPDNSMTPQEFLAHVDRLMYKDKKDRRKERAASVQ